MTPPNTHARDYLIISGAHMEISSHFYFLYSLSMKPLSNGLKEAFGLLLISFSPGTLEKVKRQQKEYDTKEAVKELCPTMASYVCSIVTFTIPVVLYTLRDGNLRAK
jgi:hypothetical protein